MTPSKSFPSTLSMDSAAFALLPFSLPLHEDDNEAPPIFLTLPFFLPFLLIFGNPAPAQEDGHFTARTAAEPVHFTPGIEAPACDLEGNVLAVNFSAQGAIGKVTPRGKGELFVQLPEDNVGNGIRIGREGHFHVADYTKHNVLLVDLRTKTITVHAHEPKMSQLNDLAIAPDGSFYASDPGRSRGRRARSSGGCGGSFRGAPRAFGCYATIFQPSKPLLCVQ